jgi:V8-like Glu-specific endopeptidase
MPFTSLRAGLVGAALVVCGVLASPVAAGATPGPPEVDTLDVSSADAAAAVDYWTPERMRAAVPAEPLAAGTAASAQAAEVEAGVPASYGGAEAEVEGGFGIESNESRSAAPGVGKVFFVLDGRGYVCSGNSVGAGNGSVVATAAHCVHGGGFGESYASKWVFVPGYDEGAAPYGLWSAVSFAVPEQWSVVADDSYDTGFVKVGEVDGQTLAQAAGASPIAFNQPRGLEYTAFGYPAAPPFDGETLKSCAGTAIADPFLEYQSQGIECDMTGGSSGGPWFLPSGAQNSVNSFGYEEIPGVMFGPYYGTVAHSAYMAAAA